MADRWHDVGMYVPLLPVRFPFPQLRRGFRTAASVTVTAVCVAGASSCSSISEPKEPQQPQRLKVQVAADYPWDSRSFTQGLEVDGDGNLLVGTGMYHESRIYRTDLAGKESDSHNLPPELFGEGLTRTGDTVWQLTWKAGVAIKRDAQTLSQTGQASYDGEGWGLCTFDDKLVMSDGSGTLTFRDRESFVPTGTLPVTMPGQDVTMLNELECVKDRPLAGIWANVWQTNDIYRIDPDTGHVLAVVDASGLLKPEEQLGADVLNGIAHQPGTDRMYLTGKYWPRVFEVQFIEQ